MRMLNSCAV